MYNIAFYKRFFHFGLLIVIVFICYSNTFQHSWHFDDTPAIVKNPSIHIQNLSWEELKKASYYSTKGSGEYSRPVAALTFALNYLYSGSDTTSYHVVNICIHIATAFFVYLVFFQTVELYTTRYGKSVSESVGNHDIALLGSVLWAIHPIQTQAITYIVQRQASLAGMFYMLAMYCYIRGRLSIHIPAQVLTILLAAIFWLLGVGAKQNAILLPLALIGYEVAFFRVSYVMLVKKKRLYQFLVLTGLALMLILFWFNGLEVYQYVTGAYPNRPFTMWQRLITEPIILLRYIFLIITPLSDFLVLESDIFASKGLLDPPLTVLAVTSITGICLMSLFLLKRLPILSFSLFFFLVNHIVESTFISLELYFEHRNYIPSIFMYLFFSFSFVMIFSFYKKMNNKLMHFIFVILVISILISEGNATYIRNDVWENDITLMTDTIDKSPENIRSYITLSVSYSDLQMYDEAIKYLKIAEELHNNNPDLYQKNWVALLYYNAGIIYTKDTNRKDEDKALSLLIKSYRIFPFDFDTNVNLGLLFFKKGEFGKSEEAYINAGMLKENLHVDYYNMYGRVLYENNKVDKAIEVFKKGLNAGRTSELQLNLIAAYIKKNDLGLARLVMRTMPIDDTDYVYLLYRALLSSGYIRDVALEKVANLLVASNTDYCEWINYIHKNNYPGIIYPDIGSFEHFISEKYINNVIFLRARTEDTIQKVKQCGATQSNISRSTSAN